MASYDSLNFEESAVAKQFMDAVFSVSNEINTNNSRLVDFVVNSFVKYNSFTTYSTIELVKTKKLKNLDEVSFYAYNYELGLNNLHNTQNYLREEEDYAITIKECTTYTVFTTFINSLLNNMHKPNSDLVHYIFAQGFKMLYVGDSKLKNDYLFENGAETSYDNIYRYHHLTRYSFLKFFIETFYLDNEMWKDTNSLGPIKSNIDNYTAAINEVNYYCSMPYKKLRWHQRALDNAKEKKAIYYKNINSLVFNFLHSYREKDKEKKRLENIKQIKKTFGK